MPFGLINYHYKKTKTSETSRHIKITVYIVQGSLFKGQMCYLAHYTYGIVKIIHSIQLSHF